MPEKQITWEGIPTNVRETQPLNFGFPITAYLCCAQAEFPCVIGIVFGDAKQRFRQSASIRTSPIDNAFEMHGLWGCKTVQGRRYVICDCAHESHPPTRNGSLHSAGARVPQRPSSVGDRHCEHASASTILLKALSYESESLLRSAQ